jgi:hypothetical protein
VREGEVLTRPSIPYKVDLPPRAEAVLDEQAEDGEPGIDHSGGILGLEIVRDGEDWRVMVAAMGPDGVKVLANLRMNAEVESVLQVRYESSMDIR